MMKSIVILHLLTTAASASSMASDLNGRPKNAGLRGGRDLKDRNSNNTKKQRTQRGSNKPDKQQQSVVAGNDMLAGEEVVLGYEDTDTAGDAVLQNEDEGQDEDKGKDEDEGQDEHAKKMRVKKERNNQKEPSAETEPEDAGNEVTTRKANHEKKRQEHINKKKQHVSDTNVDAQEEEEVSPQEDRKKKAEKSPRFEKPEKASKTKDSTSKTTEENTEPPVAEDGWMPTPAPSTDSLAVITTVSPIVVVEAEVTISASATTTTTTAMTTTSASTTTEEESATSTTTIAVADAAETEEESGTLATDEPTLAPELPECPPAYDTSKTDYIHGELIEMKEHMFQCRIGNGAGIEDLYAPYCNTPEWDESLLESNPGAKELWNDAWEHLGPCAAILLEEVMEDEISEMEGLEEP
eukprot:CAMPEP_0172318010 /NCGR_PEP_ID=MMETSP1058-20130122/33640_1 /TAXON_ID=83371 /ORGANISM="Detonula confervacea, Strain CCMP 353" /LENGTH=409 /DNA_ID=CAMNT_0013032731 /DNA_START=76 /DNA_END=1305 /DNA_ORIENTATION=+